VIYKGAENFTDAVDILDIGEADLIPNSRIRVNRLERYAFSIPVETYFISVFIHKNTHDISGLSDLVGKRLGVVKSHIGARLFRGRNDIHVKVSPNIRSALKSMLNGEIDALVYSQPAVINAAREIRANGNIRVVGGPLRTIKRGIRVTKNNAGLLEILNPAVKSFVSTAAYQRLYDKWFLKPRPFLTLSRVLWGMGGLMVVVFVGMGWWRYQSVVRLNQMLQIGAEERKAAEEQLRQAQKMEVVGQLTGGVAHDFNNLLAIIQGNIELLVDEIGPDNEKAMAALRATRRGAELTQRLLAFSRRQPLHPQSTDISTLITGMRSLLERTLGASIEVTTTIAPGLWPALADPGQMENALLNLAVNARDAMPNGGKLTIVCDNACVDETFSAKNPEVGAGDYVALAVSDTGTGMPPDVLEHVFEPTLLHHQGGGPG
jgi:signal transduction histidine kinase